MISTVSLASALDSPDLTLLQAAGRAAHQAGIRLYLVGGSVRDALLDLPVVDLDLVSEQEAVRVAQVLTQQFGGRVRARSQFGTLKLELPGLTVDLATARSERYLRPGALPSVRPGTMAQDLARRDFSINAMAVALGPEEWGHLLDPTDGQEDLRRGLVRVLHPGSFRDDATRVLRAVRYAERLGFRLEARTRRWLRRDLSYLDAISPARIRRELERMLDEAGAASCLLRAHGMGVLGAIHPSLGRGPVALALRRVRRRRPAPLALMGVLTYACGSKEAESVAVRLGLTTRQRRVVRDVQRVKAAEVELARPGLRPHQVVAQLDGVVEAAVQAVAGIALSATVRGRLRRYLERWRSVRPWLDGDSLLRLGVPYGPAVGRMLRQLQDARLDGRIRSRRGEVAYVRSAWPR